MTVTDEIFYFYTFFHLLFSFNGVGKRSPTAPQAPHRKPKISVRGLKIYAGTSTPNGQRQWDECAPRRTGLKEVSQGVVGPLSQAEKLGAVSRKAGHLKIKREAKITQYQPQAGLICPF